MLRSMLTLAVCLVLLGSSTARAHFIWLDVVAGDGGKPQARAYFGEAPEPGERRLLGRIERTKAWIRSSKGDGEEVKLAPAAGDLAALVGSCNETAPVCLEATCDYGIYERGGPAGFLLQYYAKHLQGDWLASADTLVRAKRLALDVVPVLDGKKIAFQVVYQGKPLATDEVVVIDPTGEQHELKSDDAGRVVGLPAHPGRYAVRVGYIDKAAGGERGGKKFAQTWHYCTLTFALPSPAEARATQPTAAELLKRAREGRSIWKDFPGFTADLEITSGDKRVDAKTTIEADGSVSVEMAPSPLADWVEEQLHTLVQHRKPEGEVSEGQVVFAAESSDHPLGRKIELGDGSQQSAYRIKDDMILEVNRAAGPQRFTISVLEMERDVDGKYLPHSFTMNFFDAKSGELKMSLGYLNDWQRVGSFELPKTILEIGAVKGGAGTKQIVFKNCKLLPNEKSAAK